MANITIYQPDRSETVPAPSSPPPPKKKKRKKNSAGSKLSQNSLPNFDVA